PHPPARTHTPHPPHALYFPLLPPLLPPTSPLFPYTTLFRSDLLYERLWHGLPCLVMLRVILQHFRPVRPHLVHLRRILDEIARHTRPAEARIFHGGKHAVQGVPELMKCCADLIVRQQRRL